LDSDYAVQSDGQQLPIGYLYELKDLVSTQSCNGLHPSMRGPWVKHILSPEIHVQYVTQLPARRSPQETGSVGFAELFDGEEHLLFGDSSHNLAGVGQDPYKLFPCLSGESLKYIQPTFNGKHFKALDDA